MGWCGRKDEEETCFVEEVVHFQGGENHSHSEHFG